MLIIQCRKIIGLIAIALIFIAACITIFMPLLLNRPLTLAPHSNITAIQRDAFINQLLPLIIKADEEILQERQGILSLQQIWHHTGSLTVTEHYWLIQIAKQYRVPIPPRPSTLFWSTLLLRIDIVPPSMVLAQAAVESAWGTSRFAQQGNNLFGQRCYLPGCGMVPKARPKGAIFEVSVFPTLFDAIIAYMHNLNTNHHYREMRKLRQSLRHSNQPITGLALTKGLSDYSSRKDTYIRIIQQTITHYQLKQYDAL
ncbi:MAG: hypothetical protein GY821_01120 [Gammaproteobacteria bacterium]|nr:hypothetical protein [Gammaproteobacteria bacterium]MCP4473182.1 hypothetical protein [Gammaproteobacteria bacterium]